MTLNTLAIGLVPLSCCLSAGSLIEDSIEKKRETNYNSWWDLECSSFVGITWVNEEVWRVGEREACRLSQPLHGIAGKIHSAVPSEKCFMGDSAKHSIFRWDSEEFHLASEGNKCPFIITGHSIFMNLIKAPLGNAKIRLKDSWAPLDIKKAHGFGCVFQHDQSTVSTIRACSLDLECCRESPTKWSSATSGNGGNPQNKTRKMLQW